MIKNIRQIRIDGNVAYVPLTQGYEAIIDADDAAEVGRFNWYAYVSPWTVYAARRMKNSSELRLHNFLITQRHAGMVVDHIDCNGLNNRRSNLRLATASQNQHNKRRQINNKSGFKGVSFDAKNKKWQTHICYNGTRINLGRHHTKEDAHDAYKAASAKLHGEFGRYE